MLHLRPDDPTAHVLMGNAVLEQNLRLSRERLKTEAVYPGSLHDLAADLLAFGMAHAEPSRRELLFLVWWGTLHRARLEQELPSESLIAERRALLEAIENYRPLEPEESIRRDLLRISILYKDEALQQAGLAEYVLDRHESRDPAVLNGLVKVMDGPADSGLRLEYADRLARSDPASPRYGLYLLWDAFLRADRDEALLDLQRTAEEAYPEYADDLAVMVAAVQRQDGGWMSPGSRRRLRAIDPGRNTGEVAMKLLAEEAIQARQSDRALAAVDRFSGNRGKPSRMALEVGAKALDASGEPRAAALAMLESLQLGGGDYERWYLAARYFQRAGEVAEATRVYQFYLLQLDERAAGRLPFGPPAPLPRQAQRRLQVWGHYAELQPAFFSRTSLRQLLELLALTSAATIAASRIRRARVFVLPAALAAEVVLFAGLISLRATGSAWMEISAISWLWLFSVSARTFLLVGGGLYLSALAGLPRRAGRAALPWVASAAAAAGLVGFTVGFGGDAPVFVMAEMPSGPRISELGMGPQSLLEAPAVVGAVFRTEAVGRLVWPALIAATLAGVLPRGRFRTGAVIVTASAMMAAASTVAFPLAFGGAVALTASRFRWGALAPFAIHLAFVAGALVQLGSVAAGSPG